jgi:hypothetical protein
MEALKEEGKTASESGQRGAAKHSASKGNRLIKKESSVKGYYDTAVEEVKDEDDNDDETIKKQLNTLKQKKKSSSHLHQLEEYDNDEDYQEIKKSRCVGTGMRRKQIPG